MSPPSLSFWTHRSPHPSPQTAGHWVGEGLQSSSLQTHHLPSSIFRAIPQHQVTELEAPGVWSESLWRQWDPREKVTHIHKRRYSRAAGTSRDQASRPHRQKHIVQAPRSRQRWVFTCAGTGGQSKTWGRQEPCTTCFLPLQKKGPGRAAQVASRAGGSQPRRVAAPCPESGHCTMLAPGSRWPQLGCSLTGLNSSLRSQPNKN